ncbi:DNA glycosylase [Multifurca ochricompacta]|uniref:DNA glycosylase n=1 Tax=Multifurca ochricompacta TaxID=376703 RepID=A0AAD4QNC0_9AGAM|nr:DNA glycosylase [Multifurca ochricompacta]
MPITRSASRSATKSVPKRPAESNLVVTKRLKTSDKAKVKPEVNAVSLPLIKPPSEEQVTPLPAQLTFSLQHAKDHLIQADHRFRDVFSCLPCKPFESLQGIHPFRTLCTSILGQQISWLAARAIEHKFLRLFFPELPEKPDEQYWGKTRQDVFPSAYQVATTEIATLRTAGLSGRKAEYVRDLATRFADGRLTNQKLLDANDEGLFELLTSVYGIGKAIEMFAIFSLRRPDILPVGMYHDEYVETIRLTFAGDLGVQRGLLRWVISLHQPEYRIEISPKKLPDPTADPRTAKDKSKLNVNEFQNTKEGLDRALVSPPSDASSVLPAVSATSHDVLGTPLRRDANVVADNTPGALGLPSMPPPLTPSVTRVLSRAPDAPPPPLPAGLTVASLRSRLDGKKKIKGAILTPTEMEELTESWRPYRSIGVYYMWALTEEKAES